MTHQHYLLAYGTEARIWHNMTTHLFRHIITEQLGLDIGIQLHLLSKTENVSYY